MSDEISIEGSVDIDKAESMSESSESEKSEVLSEFNISDDEIEDKDEDFFELNYDAMREISSKGAENFLTKTFETILN